MTIIEEKRNILINWINQTEDEDLLDMMNDISINNKSEFHVSEDLIDIVKKIDKDMDNGEFYTSEEIMEKVKSWA